MTGGFEMMKKLKKQGWSLFKHGHKHDLFTHELYPGFAIVPRHNKELSPGIEADLKKKIRLINNRTYAIVILSGSRKACFNPMTFSKTVFP
ncbi:MAG: type II toxin-antitoxin system HicA family toxin [Candidatus Eremiobacteraeota bacterium]|nr:type II toxin-antitoxin system HicA family toxin [Candidatus Eremiobacteraeota bacterium]